MAAGLSERVWELSDLVELLTARRSPLRHSARQARAVSVVVAARMRLFSPPFSDRNYAVSYLVRVRFALAAFLPLRPATKFSVSSRSSCLGFGLRAAKERPYVDLDSTVRAFHPANLLVKLHAVCTKIKVAHYLNFLIAAWCFQEDEL